MKDQSLSQLFKASIETCFNDDKENTLDAVNVLRQCIQLAAQRIDDSQSTATRATKRIVILLDLLNEANYDDKGQYYHFPKNFNFFG